MVEQSLALHKELSFQTLRRRVCILLITVTNIEIPGPGAYRAQSEFGFYDASDSVMTAGKRAGSAMK